MNTSAPHSPATPASGPATKAAYTAMMRARAAAEGAPIRRTLAPGLILARHLNGFLFTEPSPAGPRLMYATAGTPAREVDSAEAVEIVQATFAVAPDTRRVEVKGKKVPGPSPLRPTADQGLDGIWTQTSFDPAPLAASADLTRPQGAPGPSTGTFRTPVAVLVADRGTRRILESKVAAAAKGGQDWPATSAGRMLGFLASSRSSMLPVLTDSLTSKFWMPAGYETDEIGTWLAAFNQPLSHTADPEGFRTGVRRLAALAAQGTVSVIANAMVREEYFGTRAARYRSQAALTQAFAVSELLSNSWNAMLSTDPLLAPFNLLDGTVTAIKVTNDFSEYFLRATMVSEMTKVRAGQEVLLFTGDSQIDALDKGVLDDIGFDDLSDSSAVTVKISRGMRTRRWKVGARQGKTIYITALPYTGGSAAARLNSRWDNQRPPTAPTSPANPGLNGFGGAPAVSTPQPATVQAGPKRGVVREVPVAIALAGAPLREH